MVITQRRTTTRERLRAYRFLAQVEAAAARLLKTPEEAFWGGYSEYFADPDSSAVVTAPGPPLISSRQSPVQEAPTESAKRIYC